MVVLMHISRQFRLHLPNAISSHYSHSISKTNLGISLICIEFPFGTTINNPPFNLPLKNAQ